MEEVRAASGRWPGRWSAWRSPRRWRSTPSSRPAGPGTWTSRCSSWSNRSGRSRSATRATAMDDSKILSQNEVDALLSAIDTGDVELGIEETPEAPRVVPYDFRRPERVAREQLRAIGTLHAGLA